VAHLCLQTLPLPVDAQCNMSGDGHEGVTIATHWLGLPVHHHSSDTRIQMSRPYTHAVSSQSLVSGVVRMGSKRTQKAEISRTLSLLLYQTYYRYRRRLEEHPLVSQGEFPSKTIPVGSRWVSLRFGQLDL